MLDYYRILKISPKASAAEIKSAYRRLAREHHPDANSGAEAAREFAQIAKAYQILSDPQQRAAYDAKLSQAKYSAVPGSVVFSDNPHAQRLRRLAVQRRMDAVVDRLIERERRETLALQQAVFPVVALFLSTFFVGMLKPQFWAHSDLLGKSIVLVLFLAGLWHTIGRLRLGFERYTRRNDELHSSFLRDEPDEKPFTRMAAVAFLVVGVGISLAIGLVIGKYLEIIITSMMPTFFAASLHPELIFYPPIAVLLVDTMHTVAQKADI